MDGQHRREHVDYYRLQRERYLQSRMKANHLELAPDRRLLSTRHRYLPALLVVPFALLALAGTFDLMFLITGAGFLTLVSFALIPAGVVGCLLAVAVGAHDWFTAPAGSRVRSVGIWYALGSTLVIAIFGWSWAARFGTASDAGGLGVVLGVIGATVAVLSGLLLAEYLDRLSALRPSTSQPVHVEATVDAHWVEEIVEPRRVAHA